MTAKIVSRHGGTPSASFDDLTDSVPFFEGEQPLLELGMSCQNGAASQGKFTAVDPDSSYFTVGGLWLPSHTLIRLTEDASGDELWMAQGRVSGADMGRGIVAGGDYVEHEVTVDDANVDLRGLAFGEDWERPEETDTERLYALAPYILNGDSSTSPIFRPSTVITIDDTHLAPDTETVPMPAKTYPAGTQPTEVINDCNETAGKVYGVVIHHTGGTSHLCLLYIKETDHDTYASTIKISDQVANWDPEDLTAPVFEPVWDQGKGNVAAGQFAISGLVSRYGPNEDQFLYVNDTTFEDEREFWIDSFADSGSATQQQASDRAAGILNYRKHGDFTYRVSILMLPEQTHLITAGMSLQIDTAVAVGGPYRGTYTDQRVVGCSWAPNPDGRWWAHLQLNRGLRNSPPSQGAVQLAATTPGLGDPGFGFIETDDTWRVLNTIGVPAPTGWNTVGYDDSAWDLAFAAAGGVYPAGLTMDSEVGVPVVPSDEILLRQEFFIEAADLIGADVVLKYAADNGGRFYVNGVEIASLTPLFSGSPTSNFTSDHATTLPRASFVEGLNCVAIYATNDSAGTAGNIPPGALRAGIYIEIPTRNALGTSDNAAREDHDHRHVDILGRDAPEQHPATAVAYDNTAYWLTADEAQGAIDELASVVPNRGTSFPGSPATGLRFYRDDLGLMFGYNGTRWLSEELFTSVFLITAATPFAATTNNGLRIPAPPLQGGSDIWITGHSARFIVNSGGSALSGSHKWVGTPHTYDSAVSAANITTVNIDSGSSAVFRKIDTTIGALMNNGTEKFAIMTTWTKTGTPGTLDVLEELSYRIVAT